MEQTITSESEATMATMAILTSLLIIRIETCLR